MFLEYILKITRSIDGSDTLEKLKVSHKMMENFFKVENPTDQRIVEDLRNYYTKKHEKIKKTCLE